MSYHPVFWLFVAAVAGPLLGQIPIGLRVPVVVIEVLLGVVIGPHVMGLVHFDGFLSTMHTFAMAVTLFMAGMELDFSQIKGRPLTLAVAAGAFPSRSESPWSASSISFRPCTRP